MIRRNRSYETVGSPMIHEMEVCSWHGYAILFVPATMVMVYMFYSSCFAPNDDV